MLLDNSALILAEYSF